MSCHSTPANVAILGFYARTMRLPSTAIANEFHWLKKIGRDRAVMAPTIDEWGDFLHQRENWVRHESSLSLKKREATLARLRESYEQVPDGPTFYALNNLPVRLGQVTGPTAVLDAVDRAESRLARLENDGVGKDGESGIRPMADMLWAAVESLGLQPNKEGGMSARDEIRLAVSQIRESDMAVATPSQVYQAHEKIMMGLRGTRKAGKNT